MESVTTIVLAAHLLAVNLGSAGPLVTVWLHVRRYRHGDEAAGEAGRWLLARSLVGLSLGLLLGVLLLGLMWLGGDKAYFRVLSQVAPDRYGYALAELAFSYACLIPYLLLWDRWKHRPWLHGVLGILGSTNLLYHFPALLAIFSVAASRPDLTGTVIDGAVYHTLLVDPEIMSRVLHVWLASVAVTGVALMAFGLKQRGSEGGGRSAAIWGARIALVPTVLQLVAGVWLVLELPAAGQRSLMGGDPWATGMLGVSLIAALCLLHALLTVSLGDAQRKEIVRAMIWLTVVVVLMTAVMRRV